MGATALLALACGLIAGQFHHVFGVAPILGAILCAACFLRPRDLFIVGLSGMLIRDFLLGYSAFTLVRLVAISLVVAVVVALKIRPALRSLLIGLLLSSPIFHLTLAMGGWLAGTCSVFPKTATGLRQTIVSALPYFQRSFIGDLLFASAFLSLYAMSVYTLLGWRPRTPSTS